MVKKFSIEEITELKGNPNVREVSANTVSFTEEFKRRAYSRLVGGEHMREILSSSGIRPEVLGDGRIWSLARKLRKQAEREEGFSDLRTGKRPRPASPPAGGSVPLAKRVEELEHALAYARQEVEFLKKLQMANLEAQKSWESKHRRR